MRMQVRAFLALLASTLRLQSRRRFTPPATFGGATGARCALDRNRPARGSKVDSLIWATEWPTWASR